MAHPTPSEEELRRAYAGRRVLVTGDTGFKGSWLAVWLVELGAEVTGYALPPQGPSMFEALELASRIRHVDGDVRDREALASSVAAARPDFVFHLAAQSLVRESYTRPLETLETNVMGTAHLLEALRRAGRPCAAVIVSGDKCYENREWVHGYREDDPLGGHDVYSMSKGATELVVSSWRRSFFPVERLSEHRIAIATARAGNVIGGGDWAAERLVPDVVRALKAAEPVLLRNPRSIRPWQHVLEALGGYLLLGARLSGVGTDRPAHLCEPFNFGPAAESVVPVQTLVEHMLAEWGGGQWAPAAEHEPVKEARMLRLSIDKAHAKLGWWPRWSLAEAVRRTVQWYQQHQLGLRGGRMFAYSTREVLDYLRTGTGG